MMDALVAGAVARLVAGLAMSAVMISQQTVMVEQPLPLKYERKVEELAAVEQPPGPTQAMKLSLGIIFVLLVVCVGGMWSACSLLHP